jgi:hypothetical protein
VTSDIYATCQPRKDVLDGELSDTMFAASLDEVVNESAPQAYGEPTLFFDATWPSQGLRDLLNAVFGRLSGNKPAAPPVIRLETNLGGGKTHNLIALWHAAHGHLDPMRAMAFMDNTLLPDAPVDRVAVSVGTAAGATSFPAVDAVEARSLWQHLALQLGGPAAAEALVGDDPLVAPGADALKRLLGDEPALILIDELARYLAVAAGVEVGATTLARQTVSFLMALMEAVDAKPKASLVITTTEVTDAFGDHTQQVVDAMTEARGLMARREHVLRPSAEADLPRILSRRLFERVDDSAGRDVGRAYAEAAADAFNHGADLAADVVSTGWADEVAATWPFHPWLMRVLDKRLSTIPNFQRTRGALRLLATTIRELWDAEAPGVLAVHPHHLDLSERQIAEDLTSRLGRGELESAVRADVASQPGGDASRSEDIDHELGTPYARRLAITAYVGSLTNDVPGLPAPDLMASVLAPGDDANTMRRSLELLESRCWYLHVDHRGYRFSTEKSLVKVIQDAQSRVPLGQVRQEATSILGSVYRDAALKVRRGWEDSKVPDRERDATLVILHWDDFGDERGVDPSGPVPERVKELWERTPTGGLRQFRNRIVFLCPSAANHQAMLDAVRRKIALTALAGDETVQADLSDAKRAELKEEAQTSKLEARIAVCNHVNILYVPERDGLAVEELPTVTRASERPNQTEAVVDRLAAMDKTLSADDPPLDPAMIRSRLGAMFDEPVPTPQLSRVFAQRSDMRMVLDQGQFEKLVRAGVRNGVWELHDIAAGPDGWVTRDRPGPLSIRDDTVLHPIGSAPPVEVAECPFCGQVHDPGPCPGAGGAGGSGSGGGAGTTVSVVEVRGSATSALAETLDQVRDRGAPIKRLVVSIDEAGPSLQQELARLQSVVPDKLDGADVIWSVDIAATFDDPAHTVRLTFSGYPGDYGALKGTVEHVLRTRTATVRATCAATFDEPASPDADVVAALQGRAAKTGPSKCVVAIEADR